MSIGKRLVNLVRSNLNSLLEKSPHWDGNQARIEDLSDDELQAELERRRTRREAAQSAARQAGAARRPTTPEPNGSDGAPRGVDAEAWREVEEAMHEQTRPRARQQQRSYRERANPRNGAAATPGRDRLAQLYAQLECPYGADITAVRKQYRILMRKYHPDLHSRDAESSG